jgi:hypothetical protein
VPNPASGRRPLGEKKPTSSFETRAKGEFDKGKILFDGYAPGPTFRKKSTVEMAGEVRQASQEAPEAIEQQRIPRAAREMAKGYFRNLGGTKEPEQKKAPRSN